MIPILTSTLDKESVARILDSLFASPGPFVKENLLYILDGGEVGSARMYFFTMHNKPTDKPESLDVYILDKDVSKHAKSKTFVAIARYKIAVQASWANGQWTVHSCHLEKIPKIEKRIFKFRPTGTNTSNPYKSEQTLTTIIRAADALDSFSTSNRDFAFFSSKKYPGRNIKMLITDPKYRDQLHIENLLAWSLQICSDLQENFHSKGLLHRDIKPKNVVIDPNNQSKAKLIDLEFVIPETMKIFGLDGTHGYMARELYLAEHDRIVHKKQSPFPYSKKTDIFALSFTLAALFGNTSIQEAQHKADTEKLSKQDFIGLLTKIPLLEKPEERFKISL